MAWFKVDDKLHSHKKAARAGIAAMGLWTVAGSWCADHLTDGFVPDYITDRLAPGEAQNLAASLVAAGLWTEDSYDGDDGWRFNDWCEYQPTRTDVESVRERERDKKRRQRRDTNGQYVSPGESLGDTAGSPAGVPPTRPVPSRPDPKNTETVSRKRATQANVLPDQWTPKPEPDLIAAIGGQKAADREVDKFRDYWIAQPGAKGRKKDWQATWRNWLRNSQDFNQRATSPDPPQVSKPVFGSDDWNQREQRQRELERKFLDES